MFFNNAASLLSHRAVPNLHSDVDVTTPSLNVVGIERFRIPAFQDEALTTRLAIMQAFPGIEDVGPPFFWGGAFYLRWLHSFFLLNDSHLNHSIQLVLEDAVGFLNLTQRKAMRDERRGINPTLLY